MTPEDRKKLGDLHMAILGSRELKIEGLVHKVERHDRWIRRADVRWAGIVGAGGAVVWVLELFFKH